MHQRRSDPTAAELPKRDAKGHRDRSATGDETLAGLHAANAAALDAAHRRFVVATADRQGMSKRKH